MSDGPTGGTGTPNEDGDSPQRRTGSAGAAARRARRIGGRVGSGRPAAESGAGVEDATGGTDIEAAELAVTGTDETDAVHAGEGATGEEDAGAAPTGEGASGEGARGEAATDAADADVRDDAAASAATRTPGWLRWAPAGVLTVAAVVMAVLLIVFSHGVWWAQRSSADVRGRLLSATKSCVATTNTYKYTDISAYEKAGRKCTTGDFTNQFSKAVTSLIAKNAPKLKAEQRAQINTAAISEVSPHGRQWTVLVFGQLTVTNTNYPKGRTDPFAAVVRMQQVHGVWKMAGLRTVSSPVQS